MYPPGSRCRTARTMSAAHFTAGRLVGLGQMVRAVGWGADRLEAPGLGEHFPLPDESILDRYIPARSVGPISCGGERYASIGSTI